MRLVGGRLKGRNLAAPASRLVRPTSDRARESLFNILTHGRFSDGGVSPLVGARVLDAFAGSGALGLEALSRGAVHATFIERDPAVRVVLKQNIAALSLADRTRVIAGDALAPPRARDAVDIAFLDPPYGRDLAGPALRVLADRGWFRPAAAIVVELAIDDDFAAPAGFELVDDRRYGKARLLFLRASPPSE